MADYSNALIELFAQDPMRAINQRFGPMTPTTAAGYPNAQMSQGSLPTMGESALDALLRYGPLPAELATAIAMQPVTAGQAVGDALSNPSIGSFTNAGVQSAMALMAPTKAIGALAAGYGLAGARDLGLFGGAAEAAGLSPEQQARKADLQAKIAKGAWRSGAERRQVEGELEGLRKIETESAIKANDAEIQRKAEQDRQSQAEYKTAVDNAILMRDLERKRDRRWSDTEVGKVYNQTGGAPVIAAALAGGAGFLDRLAKGAPKTTGDYARLGAEGLGAASLGINAPLAYDAFATEADNPERRAQEVYARELPASHPGKADAKRMAESLPQSNPVRSAAQAELYDPLKFLERFGMAAVEGVPMAITGSNLPSALSSAGRGIRSAVGNTAETVGALPGNVATGYQRSLGQAATERGNSALQRSNALEAEVSLRETQRRLGEQRAAPQPQYAPAEPFPQVPFDPPPPRQLPSPVSSGNPSPQPQNNALIIPDSITGNKSRMNKTYGEQNSADMQAFVMGQAERGTSPHGLVGSKVADELGMKPTRAKTALQNIREIGEANGLDISDPKVLKAVIDELNSMPAYKNKKGNGNALFSLVGGGVGLNALMQDNNE